MGEQDAILVVDADPEAALLLSDFLEREGYSVVVAATGAEGLRRIHEERFALVLLDLKLPDVDGTVLMREAGRVDAPPAVIVVSARMPWPRTCTSSGPVRSCRPPRTTCPRSTWRRSPRPRCRSRTRASSSPCGRSGVPCTRTPSRRTSDSRTRCSGASHTSRG